MPARRQRQRRMEKSCHDVNGGAAAMIYVNCYSVVTNERILIILCSVHLDFALFVSFSICNDVFVLYVCFLLMNPRLIFHHVLSFCVDTFSAWFFYKHSRTVQTGKDMTRFVTTVKFFEFHMKVKFLTNLHLDTCYDELLLVLSYQGLNTSFHYRVSWHILPFTA